MSDDLVKQLREDQPVTQDMGSTMQCSLQDAAADRIEELELAVRYEADLAQQALDAREELEAKLSEAVAIAKEAIETMECGPFLPDRGQRLLAALAELKGQDDE